MSQKRKVDQQRIDQIAPRLTTARKGPKVTTAATPADASHAAREAGRWASRNTGQRPIVINAPPQPSARPGRAAARTFPTDGGQTPTERLVTVANDIGERSLAAREEHAPKADKSDFTRRFTGPIPPKPSGPRPDAPRPKR